MRDAGEGRALLARAARLSRIAVLASLCLLAAAPRSLVAQSAGARGALVLEGRVTSTLDGRPIAAAEVLVLRADTLRTRTDNDGRWQLRIASTDGAVLRVRALGYIAQRMELHAQSAAAPMAVTLRPAALALDQMVVSAARREQRLADAVATVEVVSRSDLERSGAADLSAVLTEQTGIELQGGHPAGSGVMLQGIGSERVLVLLDGQPLAGRLSGSFDLSRIPVAMVERVEVVKGAQSTLYGSEAMGGVINIITRRPGERDGALSGAASGTKGAQGRLDGSGRVALQGGDWASSVDVARRSQETAPGVAQDAGALAARLDVAAKLQWRPDANRQAELSLLALDERQRWRSGSFYGFSDNVQANARLAGSWQRGAHRIAPGLSLSNWDHRSYTSAFTAPVAGDAGDRQLQRVVQGELLYNGQFRRVAVDGGVQLRVDEIETERVPGGLRSHRSLEPFVQAEFSPLARVTLLPGIRLSQSNVWGTQVTPRLAARAALTDRLTLRASVGDGFRAPDFKELYLFFQNTNAGYAVRGNSALRPEASRNAMLGAEYAVPSGYVRVQAFRNDFTDFIETEIVSAPNEAPVYEYRNRDNGWTRGAEFEAAANLGASGRLRGELALSFLETRDERSDVQLLGRPSRSGRIGVTARLPFAIRSNLSAVHTGRTPMQRDAESQAISSWRDAFTRVDLRVTRQLAFNGLDLVIGADNLFDARPAEWAGFTGRHVYTSVSYTFSSGVSR